MAIDWTKPMRQTYEYYIVDPYTWANKSQYRLVTSSTVKRDLKNETLGSAQIECAEVLPECYIRIYLVAEQNKETHKECLGTFLCQTPKSKFDGRVSKISIDAYTPLAELKEKNPPIGYYLENGTDVLKTVYKLVRENARAPVVKPNESRLLSDGFVSELNDTWLVFLSDLLSYCNYRFDLDDHSRVIFSPEQDLNSMQPVWFYDDGNSSILFPDVDLDRDLYGIPNVMEVIYSTDKYTFSSRAVNDDPNSPISTVNRGREIVSRVSNPDISGGPDKSKSMTEDEKRTFQIVLDNYARRSLRDASSLECTLTYSHGYNKVRPGDCVEFNYKRSGFGKIKAKVISQSISCITGCKVEETAVYTTNLWG